MLDADYNYEIIDLPPGSFKESGTGVNTVLLKVTKPMSTPSTLTVSSGFVPDITKISQELAARSHMGTSMDPEKRAQQELSTPPARRLSEFGIGERAQWYYIPQRR
jgi:hypothetical protein